MTLRLRYAVRSHVGNVREGNEDSAFAGSRLAVVADGMGGHAAGEVASSAAVSALAHLDEDEVGTDLLDALAVAVQEANDQLRDMVNAEPGLDGMGTTLTVLLASGSRLGVAHVGDSRAYLLRDAELTLVTHDQTLVQRMVDEGQITLEQAERHPRRALLTQALDGREGVEPDLSLRELHRGDRYLLCSDGLSGVVHEETIAETLQLPDPDAAAERLIELALKGGGPDNVTVVVADVVDDTAGLSDTPMVAGAAAEKDSVPGAARLALNSTGGHLASAAEKARKFLPSRRRSPAGGAEAGGARAGGAGTTDVPVPETAPPAPPSEMNGDGNAVERSSDITGFHRLPGHGGTGSATAPDAGPSAAPATAPLSSGGAEPGTLPMDPVEEIPAAPLPARPAHRSPGGRGASAARSRSRRPLVLGLALAIVLVVILGAGWAFTRTQWYVAESDGRVALFHGVQSRPLGIPLSSVEQTYFPTSCLPPIDQGRVRNGYVADGRADAQRFVDALRAAPSAPAPSPRLPPEARTGTQRPVAPTASAAPAPGTAISSECTAVTR